MEHLFVFILFLTLVGDFHVFGDPTSTASPCLPRPFYCIAHMQNSIEELEKALQSGVNAIEVDVTFYSNGTTKSLHHGYLCDCLRNCESETEFTQYLDRVRELTTPSHPDFKKQFALLYLDTKSKSLAGDVKLTVGQDMASKMASHLWDGGNGTSLIRVILYVHDYHESDIILGFRQYLEDSGLSHLLTKIGFEIGPDPRNLSDDFLKKIGVKENVWKGDGISNCLSYFWSNRLIRRFIDERDHELSKVKKIYSWTVDFTNLMADFLRMGVDGLMTNHPERLLRLMEDPEFKCMVRLATTEDDPFERFIPQQKTQRYDHYFNRTMSPIAELAQNLLEYVHKKIA